MKTSIKNITKLVGMLLLAAVIIQGCSDVAGPSNDSSISSQDYFGEQNFNLGLGGDNISAYCIESSSATLKAGRKSEDAGTVTYSMTTSKITVTYTAKAGWGISETHLWVGDNLESMPAAGNGAPKNGHFPYSNHHDPAVTTFTYEIPLSDVGISPGDDLYIVAHAVVGELNGGSLKKTETAYAGEEDGDGPRWWWYIHETTNSTCGLDGGGTE